MAEYKATCRGLRCGKRIVMRTDAVGKPHPYDPPATCEACGGTGSIAGGSDLFGSAPARPGKKCHGTGQRWVSHFATCIDADVFRAKAEAD